MITIHIPEFDKNDVNKRFQSFKTIDIDINMNTVDAIIRTKYRSCCNNGRSVSDYEKKELAGKCSITIEAVNTILDALAQGYTIDEGNSTPDKHSKGDSGNNGNKINDTER